MKSTILSGNKSSKVSLTIFIALTIAPAAPAINTNAIMTNNIVVISLPLMNPLWVLLYKGRLTYYYDSTITTLVAILNILVFSTLKSVIGLDFRNKSGI